MNKQLERTVNKIRKDLKAIEKLNSSGDASGRINVSYYGSSEQIWDESLKIIAGEFRTNPQANHVVSVKGIDVYLVFCGQRLGLK